MTQPDFTSIEVYTIVYLWRRRAIFREARRHGVGPVFPFKIFIRVGIYTFAGGFGIMLVDVLLNTNSTASSSNVTLDLLAVVPLSVAIVFGTQEDIVQMWLFWKKKHPSHSPAQVNVRVDIEQGEIGCRDSDDSSMSDKVVSHSEHSRF
ncbi:hypothetical protein BDP27DRAFT_1429912 [Rhodocollybia butyracea]|uniref:Uncharacterized protein n=1 Tax=Rhodocollybia butyracea TaxID=206335 RepID=A0A9P5PB28_9AGAR|nr:hypothetical protein BDP27DRAFT_1429912 [Rhodocollybia butyracea]